MNEPWYTVKCLFHHPTRMSDDEEFLYEERVTLWKAASFEEAQRMAVEEARKYAEEENCVFVAWIDAFHLFDETIVSGSEVYSKMRGSHFQPPDYRKTFCHTLRDR